MNGTELRSFSHFQILTKSDTRILAEIFKLINFECEAAKVSQNDQFQM